MKTVDEFEPEQLLCLLAALLVSNDKSKIRYCSDGCVEVDFAALSEMLKTSIGIDKVSSGLRFYLHSRGVSFKPWA